MDALVLRMAGEIAADAIGALFLSSGLIKSLDIPHFASTIASYRLLPLGAAFPAARLLGPGQILLGLWLFSGQYPLAAGCVAALLCLLFSAAMGINVLRGRTSLTCGCLPGHDVPLSALSALRTMLLGLITLVCGLTERLSGFCLSALLLLCGVSLLGLLLAFLQLRMAGEPA